MREIVRFFPFWAFVLGGLIVALATGPSVVVLAFVIWWVGSGNLVPHFYPGDALMLVGTTIFSLFFSAAVFALLIGPAILVWLGAGLAAGHPIDPLSRGGRALAIAIAFFCGLESLAVIRLAPPGGGVRDMMEATAALPGFLISNPAFMAPGVIAAFWVWQYLRWLDRRVPKALSSTSGTTVLLSQVPAMAGKNDREAR